MTIYQTLLGFLDNLFGSKPAAWMVLTVVLAGLLVLTLTICVAFLTLVERKVIGYMQTRIGPNRVGPFGLLQPFADVFKLILKEVITPTRANTGLYYLGPILMMFPAVAIWAVIPFEPDAVFADIDAGLLYVMAISSFGVYGIIIAGWASNSKYALLGAFRASAQMISYELAMGFALVGVMMVAGSLNLSTIVAGQASGLAGGSVFSWNWLPLAPLCLVYLISGIAETNRAPFDIVEGESEIVAGHMIEYSGMAFALFFLAEYINMIVISILTSVLFLGGWLSPFPASWGGIGSASFLWLIAKTVFVLFLFLWFRATFPRYRYDQLMRLGWKVFIPLTLVWILVLAAWMISPWSLWPAPAA